MVKPPLPKNYIYTTLLFWCALVVVSAVYIIIPITDSLAAYFQVTEQQTAWMSSVFSVFYACGFLLFAPLSQKFGKKQIIVFGLLVLACFTFLTALPQAFNAVLTFRALQGLFAATFAPTALAYVFELFPDHWRITVIGYISFGYVLAGVTGQAVADHVNQIFDWQSVFYMFAAIYIVTALLFIWLLPKVSNETKKNVMAEYMRQLQVISKRKNLLLCYGITFPLLFTFIGMYTILGDYLQAAPYYLSDEAIYYVRALGVIGMIFSPLAAKLAGRVKELTLLRFSLCLSMISLILMGISSSLQFIVTMSITYVAGIACTFPIIMKIIGDISGLERSAASSFYAFVLFIGASLGSITLVMVEIWGRTGTHLFLAGCLAIAFLIALSMKLHGEYKRDGSFSEILLQQDKHKR